MRRKDRELTAEQAWEVVDRCADGVVSMLDGTGAPYAVPVNIVREENRVYFHSAMAGKKTDCMRAHPRVCVTCVESGAEIDQPGLTTRYASAILTGTAAEVTETEEKVNALRLLCRKIPIRRGTSTTASAAPRYGASPWMLSPARPTGANKTHNKQHRTEIFPCGAFLFQCG